MKRTAMKKKRIKRDWILAIDKVRREGRCRVCGYDWRSNGSVQLQAAHTVGRKYQDEYLERWSAHVVKPGSIVPLCDHHHRAYDARKLSLLGQLTMPELRNAIAACKRNGLDVRRRLSGGRSRRTENEAS